VKFSLKEIFSRLKKLKKKKPFVSHAYDLVLVRRVRGRRMPRLRQILHIKRILSKRELLIFRGGLFGLCIGLVWAGLAFAGQYRVEVPAVGGKYSEAVVGSPQLINPIFASVNEVDTDIVTLVYSGLLRYDKNQELVPDLAESYTLSEDKKTYTFTLRQNVVWHDGEPFTAHDVVFTFDTIQNTAVGSPLFVSFQGVRVTALDDYTVEFVLKDQFSAFLSTLTVGILPEHGWFEVPAERMRLTKKNLQPIGTGPFQYKKFKQDESGRILSYELARFADYYGNAPYIQEFAFHFFADYDGAGGAIQALREQQVDGLHFVPNDLRNRVERKYIKLYTLQVPEYTALFFNQRRQEFLQDLDVRTALAYAVDKDRILRESLQGEGGVIYSPILPGFPGYTPDIEKTPYSIEEANTLLDKKWDRISSEDLESEMRDVLIEEWRKANPPEEVVSDDMGDQNTEEAEANAAAEQDVPEEVLSGIEAKIDESLHEAQTFYRKDDEGRLLEITLVTSDTVEYKHAAELISGFWQEIGVKTNLVFADRKDFSREVLKNRSYDVLLYGMIIGNDPDQYSFWHSTQIDFPGLNLARYVNRNLDALLETARETAADDEIAETYKKIQDIIIAEKPAVFLYSPTYTYATTDKIHGIDITHISHPSDRFVDVVHWYIETKGQWK
jgi:peptide/nickel transport system substrate-binding protein